MGEQVRHEPPSQASLSAGYEVSDARLSPIIVSVVVLIVIAVVVHVLLWGLMKGFESQEQRSDPAPSPVADYRQVVPEPRLQPLIGLNDRTPAQDLILMKEQNAQVLDGYGWVDRERGVVRVPIDEAMKMLADRGLPTQPPATQGADQ